jgi:addiction module HigA family antidote
MTIKRCCKIRCSSISAGGRAGGARPSPHALVITLRLPASRISQIVRGQPAITPETALRLAHYFGGPAAIWLRLQLAYELARAEAELAASPRKSRLRSRQRRLKRTGQRFALVPLGASSSAPSTLPL